MSDMDKPKAKNELHPVVADKDLLRNSGKETGLVKPPIVSVAPATNKKSDNTEIKILNDVSLLFGDDGQEDYPYESLKIEQAFFVPTKPNSTTDKLLADIHKSIDAAKKRYGEVEVNEDGDEILEVLTIKTRKHNEDGTIQLENGKPIVGADFHHRLKYIYTRNFIAKPVMAEQEIGDGVKAEGDGVIVIRVA